MRALLISSALAAAFALSAAAGAAPTSLLPVHPEARAPASALAPLAKESVWTPRFEAAASELAEALRSRDEARWGPLLGGKWLAAADRERVRRLLEDRDSPFRPALFSKEFPHRAIFGWSAPASMSADERAAIEAGQEAEALVCWSAQADPAWPRTAVEADNRPGRPYACTRIAYSIRGGAPVWRAFIEQSQARPNE
ncbi:conserved exported protein of unknown function [uncultured Sphingopyxis sp.]|uniref:Uncharacterized protein n=1 Tax=uncultured Sphingopyxis sp. TaxID=310581 RepID=A0A1Y5PTX4_9SPHN|nr:hypothetical protein [uncultured Sphingopyxis sp.]SBV33448.1 conserved exported protein of unknown function [uncultured Sphingopyxis sp.]